MKNIKSAIGILVVSCASLSSTVALADHAHDLKLIASVKSMLAIEKDIPALDITVSSKDDIVKLSGVVDTRLQLHKIVEIAQSAEGVKRVDDSDLTIRDSSDYLKDAVITAKVKGKIRQLANQKRIGDNYDLHVETTNGVVHIFGKVVKSKDKNVIKDNVAKMDDVRQVNFNIG